MLNTYQYDIRLPIVCSAVAFSTMVKHWKPDIHAVDYQVNDSGIVFPAVQGNQLRRVWSPTWEVKQIGITAPNNTKIQNNDSISCSYINRADVSLQIEDRKCRLDHPSCWYDNEDCAIPRKIPVFNRRESRDNTGDRWRLTGTHVSTNVKSFTTSIPTPKCNKPNFNFSAIWTCLWDNSIKCVTWIINMNK